MRFHLGALARRGAVTRPGGHPPGCEHSAVEPVQAVYSDPKGTPIPLAGQSYLRVVFTARAQFARSHCTRPIPDPRCSRRIIRSC